MKLRELANEFTLARQAEGKSQATLDHYHWEIKRFQDWLDAQGRSDEIESFDAQVFEDYTAYLRENGYSATTCAHGLTLFKAIFRFAVLDDLIETSPLAKVDVPKVPETEIEHFSDDEIYRLLKTCDDQKSIIDLRDAAIMLLLYDTGILASELVDMKIKDMIDNRRILIRHGNGDKLRTIPISPNTAQAIGRYLRLRGRLYGEPAPGEPLFVSTYARGASLTHNGLNQLIKKRGRQAGLNAYPYKFRHSFAMAALRDGTRELDLRDILGHTSIDMTKRYVRQMANELPRT